MAEDLVVNTEVSAIVNMHRIATTQREKAELENILRDILESKDRKLISSCIGTSIYEILARNRIYLCKSDFAWHLIDEKKLSFGTVTSMLKKAKRQSALDGRSIDIILSEIYEELVSKSSHICKLKNGIKFYTCHSSTKSNWKYIQCAIRDIIQREMKNINHIEHCMILKDLEIDLKTLIHQYKIRINVSAKNGIPIENKQKDKQLKRKFLEVISNLDLPKPPKILNQKYGTEVRRIFRRKWADHHVDRHPGNEHVAQRFREMNDLYEIVEKYLALHGIKAALK
jgi:hypothetical protein